MVQKKNLAVTETINGAFHLLALWPWHGFKNWPPYLEGKERLKKKAGDSRLVGGKNLYTRLVLGSWKTSRSLQSRARLLKVYIEALPVFSHIFNPDGLNDTLLSQGYILENDSYCGNGRQNVHFKNKGGGGWLRGPVVKFTRSTAGGPVFRWFESWARPWHCSSNHAEAASHKPQLEGPTMKNIQLCTGGFGEKKEKIKSLKKKSMKKIYHTNTNDNKAQMAILISDKF